MSGRRLLVRTIAASTHGRYLLDAPSSGGPHPLLVGFHGYGENAERHLEQLQRIPGATNWLIAAVQALHPFYNNRTNEVVASWMTKLDRELAIADNLKYVADVIAAIARDAPLAGRPVFAGFSQGVAMAYRAAAHQPCDGVIALGGDLPPDLDEARVRALPPILIGRGRRDEWYTDEKLTTDLERLKSAGVAAESLVFDGGHEWGEEFLPVAGRFLARARRISPEF